MIAEKYTDYVATQLASNYSYAAGSTNISYYMAVDLPWIPSFSTDFFAVGK